MHMIYRMSFDLKECYDTQCQNIMRQFEKMIMLHNIDDNWKENLRQLDELRHSVQNSSYEQKDPLLIFKLESVKLWDAMINQMNDSVCTTLSLIRIFKDNAPIEQPVEVPQPQKREEPQYETHKQELNADGTAATPDNLPDAANRPRYNDPTAPKMPRIPIVNTKTPRPNDPCPCGSGLKFKNCHGKR